MMQPARQISAMRASGERPAVIVRGRRQQRKPWRIGDDLAGQQRRRELGLGRQGGGRWRGRRAARPSPAVAAEEKERAATAASIAVADAPRRSASISGPAAGALLAGAVDDHLDHRLAGFGVDGGERRGR